MLAFLRDEIIPSKANCMIISQAVGQISPLSCGVFIGPLIKDALRFLLSSPTPFLAF